MSEEYLKERSLRLGEASSAMWPKVEHRGHSRCPDGVSLQRERAGPKRGPGLDAQRPLDRKRQSDRVINCYTSYPHEYTDTERAVLTTVANQAADLYRNTELIVKTRVIQEELETRKLVERAKESS